MSRREGRKLSTIHDLLALSTHDAFGLMQPAARSALDCCENSLLKHLIRDFPPAIKTNKFVISAINLEVLVF